MTPVIFRKFNNGDTIALFPSLPVEGNAIDTACKGFAKGGLCNMDISVMRLTKEAQPADYVYLLIDMVKAGIDVTDLVFRKRIKQHINEDRIMAILEAEQAKQKAA